ncbi:hypothetical protein BD94_2220 [Elizabethkingia anophelis NUHP1]|uniref:Uncharacterized protein n=1 Tax=Elizabethkingia anophelis NUHP1 TaxID=1338011 RepID=A0A077EKL1_9FLAO|nr:hypothetical protein BD94_2220 [Elizabethkingia anophelis NUHP1]
MKTRIAITTAITKYRLSVKINSPVLSSFEYFGYLNSIYFTE